MENISVEKLGFSNRTRNALMRAKVYTLSDLLLLSEDNLLKINNMGIKSVNEVLEFQERFSCEDDATKFEVVDSVYTDENIGNQLTIHYAFPEYMGNEIQDVTYRTQNGMYVSDINIDELQFSVRTLNGLHRASYDTLNQVAYMKFRIQNI